jgi:acetyl-CoA acetyltransferase
MKAEVTGVTVSVEFGFEGDYGKGTKSFTSVQAKYPEPSNNLNEVISDGLEMYFSAWKTVLAGRCAQGLMGGTEFKDTLEGVTNRVEKLQKMLRRDDGHEG